MSLEGIDLNTEFGKWVPFGKRKKQLNSLSMQELLYIISIAQTEEWTVLDLHQLELTSIPLELFELKNLKRLYIHKNLLTSLPPHLGELINLERLYIHENRLTSIPPEISRLTKLTNLDLSSNEITSIPSELGELTALKELYFHRNRIKLIPPDIGKLTRLSSVTFSNNQLTTVPAEFGSLGRLKHLYLNENALSDVPAELGQLKRLQTLDLSHNELNVFPAELGQMPNLQLLILRQNHLASFPPELGQLKELELLDLSQNQLTSVPPELAKLERLHLLFFSQNQLTSIPPELGQLNNLRDLSVSQNPLNSPPPEVVLQGFKAVLEYLRGLQKDKQQVWVSKLLLVGEGRAGKTHLLDNLRHVPWDGTKDTTLGVEIHDLQVAHPQKHGVTMHLNAWDFGGQEIYHATHQFYLSNRSLFLLVWNAQLGYEQAKIPYWLDTIQARAPESPVLIVATNTEPRPADIPLGDLKGKYPQIVGHIEVSNTSGKGIEELESMIREAAAALPLMGQEWPRSWIEAANEIRDATCKYVTPSQFTKILSKHGLSESETRIVGRMMHDLGDILYFEDDQTINNIVILKPQWVTHYISRVLDSEKVAEGLGVLQKPLIPELWGDLDAVLYEPFLRLMEKFDLSYPTLADPNVIIVVERLKLDPPDGYDQGWASAEGKPEISMRYDFGSTVPAGVPTYFIARTHRFTTYKHWRRGAVFADGKDNKHFGLIRSDPDSRYLELSVRGPSPQAFFALLRDGLEQTLERFPGLPIKRTLPCPGHNGAPCPHRFDLRLLEKAIERNPPRETIQCGETLEDVSVTEILFGLHWKTESLILERIASLESSMKDEFRGLRELTQRGFTRQYRSEQSRIESECPNTFVLYPIDRKPWTKTLLGRKSTLQLFCQHPGEWHPTDNTGMYTIEEPPEWFAAIAPVLTEVVKVLKYAKPVVGPLADIEIPNYEDTFKNWVELTNGLADVFETIEDDEGLGLFENSRSPSMGGIFARQRQFWEAAMPSALYGAPLRALRAVLDKHDPERKYGGLQKVLTPEGDYLWLCEHHAKPYRI